MEYYKRRLIASLMLSMPLLMLIKPVRDLIHLYASYSP